MGGIACSGTNVTLRNNWCEKNRSDGISVAQNVNCIIEYNTLRSNGWFGIHISSNATNTVVCNNNIKNNHEHACIKNEGLQTIQENNICVEALYGYVSFGDDDEIPVNPMVTFKCPTTGGIAPFCCGWVWALSSSSKTSTSRATPSRGRRTCPKPSTRGKSWCIASKTTQGVKKAGHSFTHSSHVMHFSPSIPRIGI